MSATSDSLCGQLLDGRYRVLEPLGSGGGGAVYKVEDQRDKSLCALKLLAGFVAEDPGRLEYFRHEFALISRLRHPHLARALAFGQADERYYYTTELVAGQNLSSFCAAHPPAEWLLPIVQALRVLNYLHTAGLVHLDVKPGNLLVSADDDGRPVVKLVDFGMVGTRGNRLDSVRGTIPYVAPEVVRGGEIDGRADLYSLGATLYEIVSGAPPFPDADPMKSLERRLNARPGELVSDLIEPSLAAWIMRLLEPDPGRRFASAAAALNALPGTSEPLLFVEAPTGAAYRQAPFVGNQRLLTSLERFALERLAGEHPGSAEDPAQELAVPRTSALRDLDALLPSTPAAADGLGSQELNPARHVLAVLTGARGIGKSRLLREVMLKVQLQGLRVLLTTPEQGAVGALQNLLRDTGCAMPAPLGELDEASLSADETLRGRMVFAAAEKLLAVAEHQPSLWLIDDLERLDGPVTDLLLSLVFKISETGSPLAVIAASEAPEHPAVAPLLALDGVTALAVPPLDLHATRRMVEAIVHHTAAEGPLLHQVTGGVPGWVELFIRDLDERGQLRFDPDTQSWTLLPHAEVQESLAQVARRRARGIDGALAEVLAHLHLAAGPVRLDQLAICLEQEIGAIFERLCHLERMGLIERSDGESLRFSARQEQVAAAAADGLDEEERLRIHQRLFELFSAELAEHRGDATPVPLLERLARQADASGLAEQAVAYASEAAERALRLSAVPSALQHAAIALKHLQGSTRPADREKAAALRTLRAEGQLLLGQAADAESTLREALASSGARPEQRARLRLLLGRAALEQAKWEVAESEFLAASELESVELSCSALASLGRLNFRRGRYERAEELHEQALARLREAGAERELPAVLRALAEVHIEKGRYDTALTVLEEAQDRSRRFRDLAGKSESARLLSQLMLFQGRPRRSLELATEAQETATRAHLPVLLARALNQIGAVEFSLGRFSNAMARYRACQAIFQRLGDKSGAAGAANNLGCVQAMKGQLTAALESFVRCVHIFRELKNPGAVATALANIASVTLDMGELGRALEAAEEAVGEARKLGGRRVFLGSLNEKAKVLGALGRLEEARELAGEAVKGCEDIGNRELLAECLFTQGSLLTEAGELKAARQIFLRGKSVGEQGAALRNQLAATWLHCLLGAPGQALNGLRLGLKHALGLGDFRLELLARRLLAECQLRVGDLDRALRSASTAAQMASRASMLKEIPEIGALVAAIYIERGNLPQAARHAEEANRLGASQQRPALCARALYLRARSRFEADRGRRQLLEARNLAEGCGAGGLLCGIDRQLATLLVGDGRVEQGLSLAQRALGLAGDDVFERGAALATLADASAAFGDESGAATAWRECLLLLKGLWSTLASPDSDRFLGRGEVQEVRRRAQAFLSAATRHQPLSQAVWLHDDRTGLYSAQYFAHRLQVELDRAKRFERPLAIVMIGLAGFAKLGEEHGERAARFVLGRTAERLRSALRSLDVPARRNDDTLAVILSDTDVDGVSVVARRVLERARVEVDLAALEPGLRYRPRPSLGSVVFPDEGKTPEDLLSRCAQALAKALASDSGHFSFSGERPARPPSDEVSELAHSRTGRAALALGQRLLAEPLSLEALFRALVELAGPHAGAADARLYLLEEGRVVFRYPRLEAGNEPDLLAEVVRGGEAIVRASNGAELALPGELDGLLRCLLYLRREPGEPAFSERDRAVAETLLASLEQPLRTVLSMRTYELELEREKERLVQAVDVFKTKYQYQDLIGQSEAMRKVFFLLDKMTDSAHSVVIFGESGTGKELVARAIHYNGPRKDGPFWAENCAAISESLLESELFGHVKGAFSGADKDKPGLFELASGGTVFLDEISEMPERMQKKLLRVLQEREVRPVGSRTTRKVDVRILAASNRDLKELVREGRFREDLYYRLNVISIRLPPLRERKSDILPLVRHFAGEGVPIRPGFMQRLLEYDWPGNVRELENEIHRLQAMGAKEFNASVLAPKIGGPQTTESSGDTVDAWIGRPLRQVVDEVTEKLITRALDQVDWHRTRAAELLGIPTSTLFNKMKKYGIDKVFSKKPSG